MRHPGAVGLLATIGVLTSGEIAGAAPLDFLFGGPPLASRPAYRLRRKPAPPLTQDIPLPVPRPHFQDDPAPKAVAPAPSPAKPEAPKAAPAPEKLTEHPQSIEATPPTPPQPIEPTTPKAPEPTAAPKPPVPSAPKPTPSENPFVAPGHEPAPEPAGSKPLAPAPPPAKPADAPTPAPPASSVPPSPPSSAAAPSAPTPPPRPTDLAPTTLPAGKPEPAKPTIAPSGATLAFTPRSPEDDPQCPKRLMSQKVGIEPTTLGPQPDARCTVVEPVHLNDVTMPDGSKVGFPERPTIACVTADSFASYVRDMLSPLAKGTFGAAVTAVWTGPGLECRSRDHIFGAKLSAHGQGLAIDIAKLKLADGRVVEVGTPNTPAEAAFETAARAGACGYFHTVLGPGSDSYHRTHWHFDLEVRGAHGDSKYCK